MKDAKKIWIINGPNLDMLGVREPHIYGAETLQDIKTRAEKAAKAQGYDIVFVQYNGEGEIVDALHKAYAEAAAVVINAGAYTHYSYAVADAVKMLTCPVIELHLSNIFARENFRRESVISPHVTAVLCGAGAFGYELAVAAAAHALQHA